MNCIRKRIIWSDARGRGGRGRDAITGEVAITGEDAIGRDDIIGEVAITGEDTGGRDEILGADTVRPYKMADVIAGVHAIIGADAVIGADAIRPSYDECHHRADAIRPYRWIGEEPDDAVKVVGHDDEFGGVQGDFVTQLSGMKPFVVDDCTKRGQEGFAILDFAKEGFTIVGANGDEVGAGLGVIEIREADGAAVVIMVKGAHTSLPSNARLRIAWRRRAARFRL